MGVNNLEKTKNMSFIVATNVVASQPAERQPTGTPTARAKMIFSWSLVSILNQLIVTQTHLEALGTTQGPTRITEGHCLDVRATKKGSLNMIFLRFITIFVFK